MATKSRSKQQEALQLLDDLDSLSTEPADGAAGLSKPSITTHPPEGEAADVLKFLDEITQKSAEPPRPATSHLDRPASRAGTPTLRKSTERVRVGTPTAHTLHASGSATLVSSQSQPTSNESAEKGWGWGGISSVWSSASAAIQQAKSVVDEQVKHLPSNEQAKKWGEGMMNYVKTDQLEKLGQEFKNVGLSTLSDIINAVAPPISEHEVIQVWLSHDMEGYEGVESLVYKALARIMEQVEGGNLVVNKGNESVPKEKGATSERNMNAVDSLDEAIKLARVNVEELIKFNTKPAHTEATVSNPTTYSYVYIRIQPFYSKVESISQELSSTNLATEKVEQSQLQFILHLSDPDHQLIHTTYTQAIPKKWLLLWEKHDWVEDLVAESLRLGMEVLGQEYVAARMHWTEDTKESETDAAVSEKNISEST